MLKIENVVDPALYKQGFKEGYYVKKINGIPINDILDVHFNVGEKNIVVLLDNRNKEKKIKVDEKSFNGIVFEEIKPKKCGCKCIFCFVDQLPRGLRKSLYYKDEDYRFSYIYGNYVTLANLTAKDIKKIINYKLSPLYISVHATEPSVRGKMLGLKKPSDILPLLKVFSENRIKMHTQVVLCPGINDGEILKKTIEDLSELYPYVETLAVVPVGLTSHRKGLFKLKPVTKKISKKIFDIVEPYQHKFIKDFGTPFVYLSDEFYILSDKKLPDASFYDCFAQIENGVGLLRYFIDNGEKFFKKKIQKLSLKGKLCIPTGKLAFKSIKPYVEKFAQLIDTDIMLIPVKNTFFGKSITVTGLLTGKDIIETLKNKTFNYLLVPDVMLRERKDYFLDDITLRDIEKALKVKCVKFTPLLSCLYKTLVKLKKKEVNYGKAK